MHQWRTGLIGKIRLYCKELLIIHTFPAHKEVLYDSHISSRQDRPIQFTYLQQTRQSYTIHIFATDKTGLYNSHICNRQDRPIQFTYLQQTRRSSAIHTFQTHKAIVRFTFFQLTRQSVGSVLCDKPAFLSGKQYARLFMKS